MLRGPVAPEDQPGPVMVRRTLLILITGLLVARPLLRGEDPTLEAALGNLDPSSMLLTMLWFVAAVLWAVWRFWSRKATLYGGVLEAALFAVVLLTFTGAYFVAPYKYAAWLMAWEWLGMAVGFFLLRQLAVSREEQHSFFTVMLAGMVVLSVYALWQYGYEIPRDQRAFNSAEKLRQGWLKAQGELVTDDAELDAIRQRLLMPYAFGTFANPNSFAGYLVLLIPGVVGAALLCARHKHPRWQVMLASCFATLGVVALFLTSSRGAILATLLTTLGVVAFIWRDWLRTRWPYALIGVGVLALIAFGVWKSDLWTSALGKKESTAAVRLEYWRGAWQMIAEHPWFGVGPGQFGRYYPRYMDPTAGETIKEPHNFILEIWATCGIFAVVVLVATLVFFYWQTFRTLLAAPTVDGPRDVPPPEITSEPIPVRWEFYVGGMFGLLLVFVLRVSDQSQEEIVRETTRAVMAALLWFGSFALLEQIRWSDRARLLALAAGVTATLLNLLVSGGINFPSVAGPLWCAMALALNAADLTPNAWIARFKPLLYIPLPACAAVAILYLLNAFYPVTDTYSLIRHTLTAREDRKEKATPTATSIGARVSGTIAEKDFIEPLEVALTKDGRGNARLCCLISDLGAYQWMSLRSGPNLEIKALNLQDPGEDYALSAIKYALAAESLDPEGPEGYRREYNLRHGFAHYQELVAKIKLPKTLPLAAGLAARQWQMTPESGTPYQKFQDEAKKQHALAAEVMERWLKKDPNNPRLHFQLTESLFGQGKEEEALHAAQKTRDLHNQNKWPTRRLSKEQSEQLSRWFKEDNGT